MIYVRDEGGIIHTGFNFYPLSSNQFGFVLKIFKSLFVIRYNKKQKRLMIQRERYE
jgi:hypothetical protein